MEYNTNPIATIGAAFLAFYGYTTRAARRVMASGPDSDTMASNGQPDAPGNKAGDHDNGVPDAPTSRYEPTVIDVLITKAMLIKALALPREIVDAIIDLAGYWPHTTVEREYGDNKIVARGSYASGENVFLARSPPLGMSRWSPVHSNKIYPPPAIRLPKPQRPGDEFSPDDFQKVVSSPTGLLAHPCRRIVFTIRSRDQGWGGQWGDRGTYNGSWTWFEVGLERWCKNSPSTQQEQQQDQKQQLPSLSVDDLCTVIPQVQEQNGEATFVHPLLPSPDLKIQGNVTADNEVREHQVVWSYTDDIDPERDIEAAQRLGEQGRGRATGTGNFVRDLRLGDVVTMWAKARFPGWANHCEYVRMDVYYAV